MKKTILFLTVILNLGFIYSQEIGVSKNFFTTEYFRVGAVLGADISWAGSNGKTALIKNSGTIDDEFISYGQTANATYFLGIDAYSPTSVLGFITGAGINLQEYSIKNETNVSSDEIKTTNIEIPLYFRLRMGNAISKSQFWLAVGGGYSFTTKAESKEISASANFSESKDIKEYFKSLPFLSGIIGYEFMTGNSDTDKINRDTFRFLLFAKVNYDLGNRLDSNKIPEASDLLITQDPSLEFLRISLGLKVILRLSKAGELLNESIKKSIAR